MRNVTLRSKIITALYFLSALFVQAPVFATTYTASGSGNFSSPSTWVGNTAPSFNITADAIIIPVGKTVTLDNNLSLSGASSLQVDGILTQGAGRDVTIGALASLSGSGTVSVGGLNLLSQANMTFTGTYTTDSLTTAVALFQLASGLNVSQSINLTGGTLSLLTGGSLNITSGANIILSGGVVAVNGGTLNLPASYNVTYLTGSAITGLEAMGSGLNNLTVAVDSGNTLAMTSDVTIGGVLALQSGTLLIGSNTLTVMGDIAAGGSGNISPTVLSSIAVITNGSTSGLLNFADSSQIKDITINVPSVNHVTMAGDVNINGRLYLTSGTFNLGSGTLAFTGNTAIIGSGYFGGTSSSSLIINYGLLAPLNFAPGLQTLQNFTVNSGFGGVVTLGTDLTVNNLIMPQFGVLDISDVTLTVSGNMTGEGSFMANDSSSLIFNTTSNLIAPIKLVTPTIGSLTINVGNGNSADLASDLNVTQHLKLQSGSFNILANNFILSGAVSGTGDLSTDAGSNIMVNTVGGIGGTLNFASGSYAGHFEVNVGIGNAITMSGNLNVEDSLILTTGTLNLGGSTLTIAGVSVNLGNIGGTDSSNLNVSSTSGAPIALNFAPGGQTLDNFTVNVGAGNSVGLGTTLAVKGSLNLNNQSALDFSNESLTLNGDLTGSGELMVSNTSSLTIDNTNSLSAPVVLSGPLGTFVLNTVSTDSVVLGSDLTSATLIDLQSGSLVLGGYNLTVNGNIASGGTGTISSNSSSNVTVSTIDTTAGGLSFTTGENIVGNFMLHTPVSLMIESNLIVDSVLTLGGGTLNIGTDTIWVAAGGYVNGGDSTTYVVAQGGGALALSMDTAYNGWVGFAIGTQSNYAPVSIQLTSGSTGGIFYASVNAGVDSTGTIGTNLSDSQPVVAATWSVDPQINVNQNVNLIATWSTSMEVNNFDRDSAFISHYTNGAWDQIAATSVTSLGGSYYFSQRNGISSFSPFAVFGRANTLTTAVKAAASDNLFEIYPNPVSDNLIIKNAGNISDANIDITNVTGQIIAHYKLNDYTTNISLSTLSAGDYFVKIYNPGMSVVKPFIKM